MSLIIQYHIAITTILSNINRYYKAEPRFSYVNKVNYNPLWLTNFIKSMLNIQIRKIES